MGSQDNLGMAEEFVSRNEVATPLMTWDSGFDTWEHYGVRGQPYVMLLDENGATLGEWFGLTRDAIDLVESY
jgi:hypothetical protein